MDELYLSTTNRGLEQDAQRLSIGLEQLETLKREGRYILELQPADYIQYFEQVTEIVLNAGFEGILVLADEVQQYIEPRVKSSSDPISPLFNLIQMLLTRENYLCFGLILVIGLKEIGLIRDVRNDLLHRMRQLSLDLTNVYDRDFATRLWQVLSREFDFRDVASDIVAPETLEALGEIASRIDLSDGPRTVINVFRRMVERYKTYGVSTPPYTPLDLIDDLLGGAVQYTGNNQIQNVTRRALQSAIVQSDPERFENAVKLAAAYPMSGVPFRIQQKYKLENALDELMRLAIGETVINIGLPENRGMTLFGLHEGVQKTDWLSQTVRDFRRGYGEHHDVTHERAIRMFARIIKGAVFKNWTVVEERPSNFTSNYSIILQGDFQAFSARYPRRQVHVRILWEDEEHKDATINGDLSINYRLSVHPDLQDAPDRRRSAASPTNIDFENISALIPINLMYVRSEGVPPQILSQLEGVWSPYDLSPLVLMNIYEMLEEKRAENLIPQQDDQFIANAFEPDLMFNIIRDLFNSEVGEPLGGVSQGRITEIAVEQLLDYRYRDSYKTIITQTNWRSWLNKYSSAIAQLSNLYEKRGEVEVEGTKDDIASLLVTTNTGLDSFVKTFDQFLSVSRDWKGGNVGAVKFTLHELEAKIIQWLRESTSTDKLSFGGKHIEVHSLITSEIYDKGRYLGYQSEEIEELLNLLERREIIEFYQKHKIREIPSQTVDLDNVAVQIREFAQYVQDLLQGFADSNSLLSMQKYAEDWQGALEKERQTGTPDPQRVNRLSRTIQIRVGELREFAQEKQRDIGQQIKMLQRNLRPINQQHLGQLDSLIEGIVNYVDQVNVLRTHLRKHGNSVKSEVDRIHGELEQLLNTIGTEDLTYQGISRCAAESQAITDKLQKINQSVDSFDIMYRHLLEWQRLVIDGSKLLNDLQQMSHLTLDQQDKFEQLSGDIKGDISSKSNKLEALANHGIYAMPLGAITQEANEIRRAAEDQFISFQNRYYHSLTSASLYSRERIGRAFEYNISNPDESYRLLYERIQILCRDLHSQIERVLRERRQEILNVLSTPLVTKLIEEERQQIGEDGNEYIRIADERLVMLADVRLLIDDISAIRDFPEEGEGQFHYLIKAFTTALDTTRDLTDGISRLSQWLTDIGLSSQEESMLVHLQSDDSDRPTDIYDWLESSGMTSDDFWGAMRSLYEKHRIRIHITRVKR